MRYIIIILSFFVAYNAHSQVTDTQLRVRPDQDPDSILVMSNDTNSSLPTYRTGKWRKLSGLIGSVAGDSDWWKLGGTTIPTNSDSAYRSGYTLFTGLDGGLATKIEMLKNGVLRFDQDTAQAVGRYLIKSKPQESGQGNTDFNFTTISQPNTGISRNNDVFSIGWNLNPGGGVETANKIGFGEQFEGFYRSGGSDYGEWHIVHIDTNGVVRKPISWFLNHYSPALWAGDFLASEIQFNDPTNNLPFAEFRRDGTTGVYMTLTGSASGNGSQFYLDDAGDNMQITSYGMTNPHLYLFDNVATSFVHVNYLEYLNAGTDAIRIAGQDANGYLTDVPTGWGIDLNGSGTLVVDSSEVATQYDLTTISSGSTDLTIGGSGPTYTIESSTGTDVTVANLYGLTLSESPANTLNFQVDTSKVATQYDITQIPISSLKAAIATNTKDHGNYAQEWQWNTLNTSGLKLSSNTTAATSTNHKLFELSTTGGNASSGASTYGAYISNTHSGTTSTNYGLYSVATGAASANYGVYGTSNSTSVLGNAGAGVSGRNSNGGIAVEGITTSGGIGVYAESPDGYSLYSQTTNGTAGAFRHNWASNSDYGPQLDIIRNTSNGSNGAAGIGGGINFMAETSTGATSTTNQIKSIWTTATNASRVSDFIVTGVNNAVEADLLTIKGSGQMQFNKYTTGAFTSGTAVADLFVTSTGLVIAGNMNGQSWTADADDATTPTLISNQTLKITGGGGFTGITTDLFDNATTDSIVIAVNGDKFSTVTTPEADDYVLMHDENGPGADVNEKILWSDLASLVGGSDGNGIYDGSGTVPTTTTATLTNNLTFNTGAGEADLYIDGTNDLIGIGTNSPEEQLTISNEDSNLSFPTMGFHTDQTGSSSAILGRQNFIYGAENLVSITAQKKTSTTSNDAVLMVDMLNVGGTAENAMDITIKDAYAVNKPRVSLFGGMQNSRVDSVGTSITLDESYYAVRCTTSTIIITLPNANTTNNEWIGTQYWIYNDSGGNITINPNGTNDTVNGSNADITVADNAGYYLMLMSTTAGAVNNWMGLKTP